MFSLLIASNLEDCRVEVEISIGTGALVAILYEDSGGWQLGRFSEVDIEIPESIMESAKARLRLYVNRTGANAPKGLTRVGLALWLMTKADGTAMSLPAV